MALNPRSSLRRLLTVGAAATALLTGAPATASAPAEPAPASASRHTDGEAEALRPLAALSARRLATADLVAAAKWGTGSPVDDPVREQQVLDAVARQAAELGTDPRRAARIFRDQIEANKLVQRGLHRRWDAYPAQAPVERPDLGEVRKEINRVNDALVRAIAASGEARASSRCVPSLAGAAARVRHDRHLDALHTVALARSVRSVCGGEDRDRAS
ncbi:chorismate mutase [Streptomyces sp. NPDC059788]|uniref:chorismate mutase n=1 Tax=Streptomyces sp. NPDC059788 TaxID=3346948 RepID=UPI00364B41AF